MRFELPGLTKLRQLTVAGVGLKPPTGDEGTLSSNLQCLTFDAGWDPIGLDTTTRAPEEWWAYLDRSSSASHQLKQLHVVGFHAGEEPSMFTSMDFGFAPNLREFRGYFAASGDHQGQCQCFWEMPRSLSKLIKLEVLHVCTWQDMQLRGWELPWENNVLSLSEPDQPAPGDEVLRCCTNLVSLKWLYTSQESFHAPLPKLTSLAVRLDGSIDRVPDDWLTPEAYPQLRKLWLAVAGNFDWMMLEPLTALTQITCLRLDMGFVYFMRGDTWEDWCGDWSRLPMLGPALPQLQRLELVNYCQRGGDREKNLPLACPDLSMFTQVKQLKLLAGTRFEEVVEEPRLQEWGQGLSKLPQLEDLELTGYHSVCPKMVVGLVKGVTATLTRLAVGVPVKRGVLRQGWEVGEVPVGYGGLEQQLQSIRPGLKFIAFNCLSYS